MGKRLGNRIVVNGPLQYSAQQVSRDIGNLKAALAKAKQQHPALAFLPVVAPASALPGAKLEHYKDEESSCPRSPMRCAPEYKAIVDAGLYVQIDDAFLPYMHERMVPPMWNARLPRWAALRVDALNQALAACRTTDPLSHLLGQLARPAHVRRAAQGHRRSRAPGAGRPLVVEGANPRHEHEWRVWETAKLPPGKVLIPGVIATPPTSSSIPELVAERIVRLAKLVGRENVIAGTDCGFAQSPFARRVHPCIMWAKLKSLAEGARIATATLWGKQAAA